MLVSSSDYTIAILIIQTAEHHKWPGNRDAQGEHVESLKVLIFAVLNDIQTRSGSSARSGKVRNLRRVLSQGSIGLVQEESR